VAPITIEGLPGGKDKLGSGLHVVPLKSVASQEMRRILEPMTATDLKTTLNALNGVAEVKVTSSPSLTVMDNGIAVLPIADQVPITTASIVGVPGAAIVNSASYRETGVILSITPRIDTSGRIVRCPAVPRAAPEPGEGRPDRAVRVIPRRGKGGW
jgi:general secretion pathway protein D